MEYDTDGNYILDKKNFSYKEEMNAVLLLQRKILIMKNELNGTGYGFIFLKELKEIADTYSNSCYIFDAIFNDCFDIFDKEKIFFFEDIKTYRILWNFFVNYFIDDSFVINFLVELLFIFGTYKQHEIVKYMHDLVLYRWNIHSILNRIKDYIEKILGPEEIFDEKEKVEKMNNIDDVMKYIEGDEKPKKKKKKKKNKNENIINNINIEEDKGDNLDDIDIDIDDNISIISEADSVLESFKNDLIEETGFNTGNKIIPQLSSEF